MSGKKETEGGAAESGAAEAGRDYDPTAPECGEKGGSERELERGPVTHDTPLERGEYVRLKERARRGGPGERDQPAQHDSEP
ncbi:MAG TPA: hypothetical protein VF121_05840 [Thermoanaerobaculia bacterium]|nr:hypothetical protein [Thermoanaerobaculia bacterium]